MEDMSSSLWSYQEGLDELKQRLLYTTLELETVRMEANEDMRKNKENVKQLIQLLKMAYQERDEARDQIQKLLNKSMPFTNPPTEKLFTSLSQFQPESPIIKPTKANSSITESDSLSDTYNYQSHGSSPVESFFDGVSSPELSNINMTDSRNHLAFVNHPFVQEYNGNVSTNLVPSGAPKVVDQGTLVIDGIVKGKALPQKGKLLQSVLEAGPLLQTLLVAGPLPRWRNPPPLQAFQIPPVSIKGWENEVSCGSSQMLSAPTTMLNFGSGGCGSGLGGGRLVPTGANANNHVLPPGKRQRLH